MAIKKRQKSLSHGRPPVSKEKERMSSKQTRTIIRTHHRLHKEHAVALKKGDMESAEAVSKAIERNGGLKVYQTASKQGQSKLRGGDSSKVLVDWLHKADILKPRNDSARNSVRLLEIGALSTKNEISKFPKIIDVIRIDLNSQEPSIEQQDFMQRPLPVSLDEKFDIISLSLVLNYVPDPVGRGEMLKRISQFLRPNDSRSSTANPILPALFLVLPRPCVGNSRYLDEPTLVQVLESLGFIMTYKKDTPKLCHYLFTLTGKDNGVKFEKRKIKDGPAMNNFYIVIK